jgi:leucyl aminopeptidase (aminopeptidase T)
MTSTLMKMRNARKVVRLLGGAEEGTRLLILHDPFTAHNVEALAIAADEVGAETASMQMTPGGHHGRQLSPMVAAAMKEAELVVSPARQNIAHTQARRDAQAGGTRVICLPEADSEDFFLAKGWEADFTGLRREIDALADALTAAKTARVRSALGTDITMSIEGRRGRSVNGFANTEDISAGYCLEASLAPVEGTAEGVIMVNASIPGVALIESEPVRIVFEKGMAVTIEGGREAKIFRDLLASFDDPNVYNLGELGVGMNPMCTLDGTMLSDESVYGGFQLALGTSAYIGGTCKAAAHYDTVLTDAALDLDGKTVFENDRLLLPH